MNCHMYFDAATRALQRCACTSMLLCTAAVRVSLPPPKKKYKMHGFVQDCFLKQRGEVCEMSVTVKNSSAFMLMKYLGGGGQE